MSRRRIHPAGIAAGIATAGIAITGFLGLAAPAGAASLRRPRRGQSPHQLERRGLRPGALAARGAGRAGRLRRRRSGPGATCGTT